MSPIGIRTLVLVCIFGAVVLAAETALRAMASARTEGKAINLRLSLIARGRSTIAASASAWTRVTSWHRATTSRRRTVMPRRSRYSSS